MKLRTFPIVVLLTMSMLVTAHAQTKVVPSQRAKQVKPQTSSDFAVQFTQETDAISVLVGEQLFTRYEYKKYSKPILYPVFGPAQLPMTRSGPMKPVAGEADDHPHHKSIWVGHELNGVDFWTEKGGSVVHESVAISVEEKSISAKSVWKSNEGKSIVRDETVFRFGASEKQRYIDVAITFVAEYGDVVFQDTKEGMFAIRTHPNLRLKADKKAGVEKVSGAALNSNGTTGTPIWGEPAKWVYYWGMINKQAVGIAMFDHPSNLRHPTTWHAREYGLVAANPFGLHYFKKDKKGAGQHMLKKGERLTFRYRVSFQLGQQTAAGLNDQFEAFTKD